MPDRENVTRWEYKTLSVKLDEGYLDDQNVDSVLEGLGREGWELVSVSPVVSGGSTTMLVHHFRRVPESRRSVGF